VKGRISANSGGPEDLTAAQARALLNIADGATAAGAAGDAFAASHPTAGHAAATATAAGFMAAGDKAKLDAATAGATASTLMLRDANGRAQVANPSANADVANKSYVDAAVAIKLDDLRVPDDNTDLNATTARHGLLPMLDGDVGHVLRGDGTFGTVPGGGGGAAPGTTLAVYADDPLIGSTDDVIEVYLGKRVTLPAYNAGKRDRIVIINAGNSACAIKAHQMPSVVRGVTLADDGAAGTYSQRFVLSGHSSNAVFGKVMTLAAWVRAANDGATTRCLFSIIDGTKYFRIITAGTYSGANLGDYLALQSYDGTRLVLDMRFPWTRGVLHHVVASINVGVSPNSVAKCAIDGISVAPLAGWTMLNYPLLGRQHNGHSENWQRDHCQFDTGMERLDSAACILECFLRRGVGRKHPPILQQRSCRFWRQWPRARGFSGTPPLIFFNAEPAASYQVVNAGTNGR
jgi:hypothetical protein